MKLQASVGVSTRVSLRCRFMSETNGLGADIVMVPAFIVDSPSQV